MFTKTDVPQFARKVKEASAFAVLFFVTLAGVMLTSHLAFAYYSNIDTAELLKPGEYQAGLESQYVFDNIPGANVVAHFDMGANENSNLKFVAGSGRTIVQGGAFYKVVPIPDIAGQPGIGIFGGLLYANRDGNSILNIRLHPEISKKFKTVEAGYLTPYLALPFGVAFLPGNTQYPFQLALGSRWLPQGFKNTNFWGEFGLELNNAAFSYVSIGISIPFSDTNPFAFD